MVAIKVEFFFIQEQAGFFCSSSPVKEAGFFPDFFKDLSRPVSPIIPQLELPPSKNGSGGKVDVTEQKDLNEKGSNKAARRNKGKNDEKHEDIPNAKNIWRAPQKKRRVKHRNIKFDSVSTRLLGAEDKCQLQQGEWLTDKHVNVFNNLVSCQFPKQNGFQCPLLLGELLNYGSSNEDFVQIVNLSRQHWVCVSNIFSSPGVVDVYDSIPSYSMKSFALQTQVATIMKSSAKSFQLRHIDVQRQIGTNDCALFAMAFATSLCLRRDPTTESYLQASMRQHFMACYDNQKILPFPNSSHHRRLGRQKIIHVQRVDIFCICHLPWNSKENERGPLVQCYMCKEWYHQLCMNINQDVIDQPLIKYCCIICLCVSGIPF